MAVSLPESADFEGYLEKHGTGTVSKLLGKQKKTWCFLQDAWLYCHQSNNKRSSVVSSIDLTEAQMIRKINSDKSGLQFEIVTKFKNITFTAGTTNECNEWIKHLQKAMTFKDNINVPTTDRKSTNLHHYDEIDMNQGHKNTVQHASSSSAQYEDIDKFHTSVSPKADTSSHYASIDDDEVFTSKNNDKSPVSNVCEYSTVIPKEQRKTPSKDDISSSQKPTEKCPLDSSAEKKNSIENNNIRKDSQNENPSAKRNISERQDQDKTAVNSSKGDNEVNLEAEEEESIDDVHSMIPTNFPELKEELYSLSENDMKPISDLKTFLHDNNLNLDKRPLTQISTAKTEITDPFESLKAYLKSLDL
ncbi:hypothetical protein LOTGIDRAFT_237295 [Lottia gigantea]|uniref:PH domain-containing protein n=1 Tax=Lottia gigantea TaxID=225164 RepID=V4CQB3_LOTGI|nr:hypothetical protein LOTGIDRAFT_237295 [Lottia gigantea]ESP04650.1 hypothetical protein LOTGIDRAFT_237295 [Lottia gigantea]